MARDLSPTVAAAVVTRVVRVAFFAEFQFASGTLRMWSGVGDKTWDSVVWTGAGALGGISAVDETTEIGASGLTFTLSGIPSELRAVALSDPYRGRPCKAWLAVLDEDDEIEGTYQFYGGRMDMLLIDAAGESTRISIQSESRLIDLFRPRTSRYTSAEQKRISPGDTSCDRTAKLAEQPLLWGVAPTSNTASTSYSGSGGSSRPGTAAVIK